MDAASHAELTELYRTHRRRALAVARRILKDPAAAEDVVQEVFIRLFSRPDAFHGQSAYATWLHRVMVNSSINALRSQNRRARLRHSPEPSASPEDQAFGHELEAALQRALTQVSAQHRAVLTLRELNGLSYPEIAKRLALPEGTVKSALNRGRRHLQELLLAEGLCA